MNLKKNKKYSELKRGRVRNGVLPGNKFSKVSTYTLYPISGTIWYLHNLNGGCRGCDRMVVGFTVQSMPITTKVVSLNPVHGEVYSIQLYVIKVCELLSNLQQVGFLQVLWFPPPIKLITTI